LGLVTVSSPIRYGLATTTRRFDQPRSGATMRQCRNGEDLQLFIAVFSVSVRVPAVRTPRLTSVHGAFSGDMIVLG
jgi:hypothetical protein